ncbi:MAG: hypothetical protein ACRCYU_20025, partial [Nocardioides sp.]
GSLPPEARMRLTAPLRARIPMPSEVRESARSIPLRRSTWEARLAGLRLILEQLDAARDPANFAADSWSGLSDGLGRLAAARHDLLAMLVALAPFDARDILRAEEPEPHAPSSMDGGLGVGLLDACDAAIDVVLDAIENGETAPRLDVAMSSYAPEVPTVALPMTAEVMAVTFAMSTVPVDTDGAFSASKVFEAFKYENARLLGYLLAHMRSLGIEPVDDMLAMVSISGWISSAPDAVLAWQSFRAMTLRLLHPSTAPDAENTSPVLADAIAHLARRDEALRQGRRVIHARIREFLLSEDSEVGAHALADAYRRLVDGPVREFAWAMRRLSVGAWSPTPTVGLLVEAFSNDEWLAPAVVPMLFPEVRNGQAHEDLVWDGKRQVFVVEGSDVDLKRVDIAVADAISFTLGCEAALAYWNATQVEPGSVAPGPDEPGRMARWRRAEALVGTNGLGLVSFKHNSRHAEVRVERLHRQDINPALQLLVHARRLLPDIETFAVFSNEVGAATEPLITVTAASLDATYPVWVKAREAFDSMPLAAFLPANLNARLRDQTESEAARAVAWIALDDALSAIDEHPGHWTVETVWETKTRVDVARFALVECEATLSDPSQLRRSRQVLDAVFSDLDRLTDESHETVVDRLDSVIVLRSDWMALGPVARLPRIVEVREDASPGYLTRAGRRTSTPFDRFTSM